VANQGEAGPRWVGGDDGRRLGWWAAWQFMSSLRLDFF
jgi:hypothetical protein